MSVSLSVRAITRFYMTNAIKTPNAKIPVHIHPKKMNLPRSIFIFVVRPHCHESRKPTTAVPRSISSKGTR